MPTKAELRAKRLARIASSIRDFATPDYLLEEEQDISEEQSLPSRLWNLGDLFEDQVPPVSQDTTFRGPHRGREVLTPIFRTLQDTRPPRGVPR
jgi:hypothetical protein